MRPPAFSLLVGLLLGLAAGCGRGRGAKPSVNALEQAFPDGAANELVGVAISAIRTNDYGAGVLVLESAQRSTTATAGQLKAIHETREALIADLVSRADAGDPQAKAALMLIERARSQ